MDATNSGESLGSMELGFHENYISLKTEIAALKRKNECRSAADIYRLCNEIEYKILEEEKEANLSFIHNKVRKLDAGSDLCKDMCLLQSHFTSLEINSAVCETLEKEKYDNILSRIEKQKRMDKRREMFFKIQALHTIKESLENESEGDEEAGEEVNDGGAKSLRGTGIAEVVPEPGQNGIPGIVEESPSLDLEPEYVAEKIRDERSNIHDQTIIPHDEQCTLNEVRAHERSELHVTIPNVNDAVEDVVDPKMSVDLKEIRDILDDLEAPQEPPEVNQEDPQPTIDSDIILDVLPPAEGEASRRPKRRRRPVYDEKTKIKRYMERAKRLNQSTTVERIIVYEGPPTILNALTLDHAFSTPAVNNGYVGSKKSSVLDRLYRRHAVTEQRPHSDAVWETPRRQTVRAEQSMQIEKEVEVEALREAQRPGLESRTRTDVKPTDLSEVEFELAQLRGVPVARIIASETEPMQRVSNLIGPSDPWLPGKCPRVQGLEMSEVRAPPEPPSSDHHGPPPSDQWREFRFVRNCLEDLWRRQDGTGLVKGASLRDVLESRSDWTRSNAVTLVRILDKMSLRREITITGDGAVVAHPFDVPYVSEKQCRLVGEFHRY